MPVIDFDPPERFVAGTVGPPGQRTFFLQARARDRVVAVSCEKEQVSVLADRLNDLLDEVGGELAGEAAAARHTDNAALDAPIHDEFRVVALSIGWDPRRSVIVVEAHEADPAETSDPEPASPDDPATPPAAGETGAAAVGSVLRVVLEPAMARAFARRCQAVVSAGRPPCPLCGNPLDPEGHVCPRANGYRR